MIIALEQAHLDKADEAGALRELMNAGKGDSPGYRDRTPNMLTSGQASRLGVAGEIAVHLLLDVDLRTTTFVYTPEVYEQVGLRKRADLTWRGRKIEVRNAIKPDSMLPIKQKDIDADAIVVQVYVEYDRVGSRIRPTGRVPVLGWAYASDYKQRQYRKADTFYMTKKRDIETLFELEELV